MSTAKLYRATVTLLWTGSHRAEVERFWIAASSRKQARDRAIAASTANSWRLKEGLVHVHIENFAGGTSVLERFQLKQERPA
jgi:hypothetical protein